MEKDDGFSPVVLDDTDWTKQSQELRALITKLEEERTKLNNLIENASKTLVKMRAASSYDYSEMPYWSDFVIKQLGYNEK